MLNDSDIIAFVSTTAAERARQFYGGKLGLRLVDETPYALVFDCHGTMLRVTVVAALAPAPFAVLGWMVTDINATLAALLAAGIQTVRYDGMTQDPTGVWTTPNGDKVAWFRDPDGNTLSVTEFSGGTR